MVPALPSAQQPPWSYTFFSARFASTASPSCRGEGEAAVAQRHRIVAEHFGASVAPCRYIFVFVGGD